MSRLEVYVGGVPRETRERDLERFFEGFGRLKRISLKNGFAFVEFESSRDAEDAIHKMNGKKLLDKRVTLDVARGKPRSREMSNGRSYQDQQHFRGGQRRPIRTNHRLLVKNLSSAVSWQGLKDYMRQAGEVTYGDAHRPRRNEGLVEFASRSDLKAALKLLDGTKLKGSRISLCEDEQMRRDRSRSLTGSFGSFAESRSRASSSPMRVHNGPRTPRSLSRGLRRRAESSSLSRSASCDKPQRRTSSHSRTESSRSRSRSRSSRNSVKHSRRYKYSRTSKSCSRSRSINRDMSCSSKSVSDKSLVESGTRCKKRSRSRSTSRSPAKRMKLAEEIHVPENTSPRAQVTHAQVSHSPEEGML